MSTETASSTATPSQTPTPTASPTPTVSPTPELGSPFGQERVYIAYTVVSNPHNQSFEQAFLRAVSYWNNAGNQYSTYPVILTKTDDIAQADIVVRYGTSADDCGFVEDVSHVGCAPLLDDSRPDSIPVTVRVEAGYTADATAETTMHEIGHVLGIEHGEEPMPLMNESSVIPEVEQSDAVNRTNPWGRTNLTYYIGDGLTGEQEFYIRKAFDFFENGANGDANIAWTFREVHFKGKADFIITEGSAVQWDCSADWPSCGTAYGLSPDADPWLEEYTRYELELDNPNDEEATAWWTAVWLYYATNSLDDGDLPDWFAGLDYEERRDDWWR